MPRIKNRNDVLAGGFLILVALLAFYLAWPLGRSSTVGLGPGYVPKALAGMLLIFGLVIALGGLLVEGEAREPWFPRPLLLILSSIVYFAVTIEGLGLVIALFGLVHIACAANRDTRLHEAALLALGSVVFSVLLFVKALGLPLRLWPPQLWGG